MTFLKLNSDIFAFWEFISREVLKMVTFEKKNDPESIPNESRISPEPFRSNFHIIFTLKDPEIADFQLKLNKQFQSMPEIWQGCRYPSARSRSPDRAVSSALLNSAWLVKCVQRPSSDCVKERTCNSKTAQRLHFSATSSEPR